jgi:hypothetical protein
MPLFPPVTTATFPSNLPIDILLQNRYHHSSLSSCFFAERSVLIHMLCQTKSSFRGQRN